MRILPDAPDIRRALRTGYPYSERYPVCQYCGGDFGSAAYYVESEWVCSDCFREWVDHCFLTNRAELADMLGVDVRYIV